MAYRNGRLASAFLLIAFGVSATASADSLYSRLGGTPVVTAFVADTVDRIVANPETNGFFGNVNPQLMKDLLTERICTLTGGGCTDNSSLREIRAAQRLTELSGLIEALRESMRARDVPLAARNQLLEILAPMTRDVAKL